MDYIPDSYENRYNWLVNLKQEVNDNAATLKLDANALAAFNQMVDALIAVYKAVIDAQSALDQATGNAQQLFAAEVKDLRTFIDHVKAIPTFTDGMGAAMQIFTTDNTPAEADIKPHIKATAERGRIVITGTKNYAERVNIYMRRKGAAWMLIGVKVKRFPFYDETALLTPGTPEDREYMARGVIGDEEIGHDSDITGCTFGG